MHVMSAERLLQVLDTVRGPVGCSERAVRLLDLDPINDGFVPPFRRLHSVCVCHLCPLFRCLSSLSCVRPPPVSILI